MPMNVSIASSAARYSGLVLAQVDPPGVPVPVGMPATIASAPSCLASHVTRVPECVLRSQGEGVRTV